MIFETFMNKQFAKDYTGLDDDMPDRFDKWVGNLDVDEWYLYADMWHLKESIDSLTKLKEKL